MGGGDVASLAPVLRQGVDLYLDPALWNAPDDAALTMRPSCRMQKPIPRKSTRATQEMDVVFGAKALPPRGVRSRFIRSTTYPADADCEPLEVRPVQGAGVMSRSRAGPGRGP